MSEDQPRLTSRIIVKHLASTAVGMAASAFTVKAIDDYTGFEKDDFVVKLGGGLVGFVIATKVQPYTDTAVDKTFDFVAEKREARKARKTEKNAEKK